MVVLLSSCTSTKSSVGYERSHLALDITQNEAGEYVYCDSCPKPTLKILDVEVGNAPKIIAQAPGVLNEVGSDILREVQAGGLTLNPYKPAVQAEPLKAGESTNQIKTVFFEMDSSILSNKDKTYLSNLRFDENTTIQINGYTDAYGGDVYNLALSERRALSVYKILKINNPNNKVHLVSKGKCCYLTSSPFDPKNRRVEIVVQKNK